MEPHVRDGVQHIRVRAVFLGLGKPRRYQRRQHRHRQAAGAVIEGQSAQQPQSREHRARLRRRFAEGRRNAAQKPSANATSHKSASPASAASYSQPLAPSGGRAGSRRAAWTGRTASPCSRPAAPRRPPEAGRAPPGAAPRTPARPTRTPSARRETSAARWRGAIHAAEFVARAAARISPTPTGRRGNALRRAGPRWSGPPASPGRPACRSPPTPPAGSPRPVAGRTPGCGSSCRRR